MREKEQLLLNQSENHHEMKFLSNDLKNLLNRGTINFALRFLIAASLNHHRDFAQDTEGIIKHVEDSFMVSGSENIPLNDSRLIIVCNHPDIINFLLGSFLISQTFAKTRKEKNLPTRIHWFIGRNVPRQNLPEKKIPRLFTEFAFKVIDDIFLKSIVKTYDFISVPTLDKNNQKQALLLERGKAYLRGLNYLKEKEIVGILPEAAFSDNGELRDFQLGLGKMIKKINDQELQVLPVMISRNKGTKILHVKFGRTLKADYDQTVGKITQDIQKNLALLNIP